VASKPQLDTALLVTGAHGVPAQSPVEWGSRDDSGTYREDVPERIVRISGDVYLGSVLVMVGVESGASGPLVQLLVDQEHS